jgi:hypothetical protein
VQRAVRLLAVLAALAVAAVPLGTVLGPSNYLPDPFHFWVERKILSGEWGPLFVDRPVERYFVCPLWEHFERFVVVNAAMVFVGLMALSLVGQMAYRQLRYR